MVFGFCRAGSTGKVGLTYQEMDDATFGKELHQRHFDE